MTESCVKEKTPMRSCSIGALLRQGHREFVEDEPALSAAGGSGYGIGDTSTLDVFVYCEPALPALVAEEADDALSQRRRYGGPIHHPVGSTAPVKDALKESISAPGYCYILSYHSIRGLPAPLIVRVHGM